MPTNLYGPGDNFDLEISHVLPALLRKCHEAKLAESATVTIWGTGSPKREFLYVDDLAYATLHLMLNYDDSEIINVGTGEDICISDLAALIKDIVDFTGWPEFDEKRPDGTPRKLLDISKLSNTGRTCRTALADGIRLTYEWYLEHYDIARV
jgi:GDP-L-fucose synthase